MAQAINRAFKISDGLANLASKKLKNAIEELAKEGVVTPQEKKKIIEQMDKVKKNIYDTVSRELKKTLDKTMGKLVFKTASKKKRK